MFKETEHNQPQEPFVEGQAEEDIWFDEQIKKARQEVIQKIREWSEGQSIMIEITKHKAGQPNTDEGILLAHLDLRDFLNNL